MPRRRALALAVAIAAGAAAGVLSAPPAHAAAVNGLNATIALSNCSAALVRYPTSLDADRALMLTNGHCYEGAMPGAGVVLQNRTSSRSGTLLNAAGTGLGTVRADRLLYATMTNTDVSLYQLTDTFAALKTRYGVTALTLSSSHPVDGSTIAIPSSYWKQTWNCQINGFVTTLREDQWTWHDSIRYNTGCNTTHGTSGSPIIDATSGAIVGINNTGNDDGQSCTLNNPCEVDQNGTTTVHKGQSYGEQTYWFTTCLNSANAIDLNKSGCLLTKPPGSGPCTAGQVLANPGFESGATAWTGSTGVIGQHAGDGQAAHGGTWSAWLDGYGSTHTESLAQPVTIPAGCHAVLSFWLHIDTKETTTSTAYDKLTVQVGSSTVATLSNLNAAAGYVQRTYDISALSGSLKFTGTEDSSLQTSFVLDDVAVTLS
jgi:hypothetical protein